MNKPSLRYKLNKMLKMLIIEIPWGEVHICMMNISDFFADLSRHIVKDNASVQALLDKGNEKRYVFNQDFISVYSHSQLIISNMRVLLGLVSNHTSTESCCGVVFTRQDSVSEAHMHVKWPKIGAVVN